MTVEPAPAPPRDAAPPGRPHRYNGAHPVHSNMPTPIHAHCSCGWRSAPAINGEFAYQQWESHLADVERPAELAREAPRSASVSLR